MILHQRYFVRRGANAAGVTTWAVIDRLTDQGLAEYATRILARADARERNATCENHGRLEP